MSTKILEVNNPINLMFNTIENFESETRVLIIMKVL